MDKIRDLREKFFLIDDEYLNGYAKLCGINATGVYLSLCRHANKNQQCFPSKRLVAEELAISERSVYSALKMLENWNIIQIENRGRDDTGKFNNLLYTLLDKKVWKSKPDQQQQVPSANGAVGKIEQSPSANNDSHRRQQVPNKVTHIKGTHSKESAAAAATAQKKKALDDPTPMTLEKFMTWCKTSPHRHVHLIGEYADEKKIAHSTIGQWQSFMQRNLRPARLLSPYTDQQLADAMSQLNTARKDYLKKWTLETLLKYLEDK